MASNLHISISAEPIAQIGGLVISNSIFTSLIVSAILIFLGILVRSKLKSTDRPRGLQNFFEWVIESLESLVSSVTNSKDKTKQFFPFIATFFLFILLNNLLGLLPGVGTIGFTETDSSEKYVAKAQAVEENQITVDGKVVEEVNKHLNQNVEKHTEENEIHEEKFVPYLRAGTADLNTTLALGIISIVLTQYFGLKNLGLSYLKKYFNFSNPIMFLVGILELVSEFAKIISFAFRLFGNIFAGEVLLAVISSLVFVVLPMPFYGLEIFVGFIQALVFTMLSLVFFNMATQSHSDH